MQYVHNRMCLDNVIFSAKYLKITERTRQPAMIFTNVHSIPFGRSCSNLADNLAKYKRKHSPTIVIFKTHTMIC